MLTAYQNKGIASKLMQHTLEVYKDVRQKVLLTEDALMYVIFMKSMVFRHAFKVMQSYLQYKVK